MWQNIYLILSRILAFLKVLGLGASSWAGYPALTRASSFYAVILAIFELVLINEWFFFLQFWIRNKTICLQTTSLHNWTLLTTATLKNTYKTTTLSKMRLAESETNRQLKFNIQDKERMIK